jgi:hypothetical protein
MGTVTALATSTIRLSPGWNAFYYWLIWVVCIAGLAIIIWAALRSKRWQRWTTQDILIVAALGVLLEVYDNIIGDQFIKPLLNVIPGAEFLQLHDLPYMFLLMVGVALVRKPGCVTAMVFVNFLLAQLLFGSGHGALDWTDGLTQAIFCDLYIVARRGAVFGPGASKLSMVIDGFVIGVLRGPHVRRVEDQPADDGALARHAARTEVVRQRGPADRHRQQHRLEHPGRIRGERPGRVHRHLRPVLRPGGSQARPAALPAGLRAAGSAAGPDPHGRQQPAGRLGRDLRRLPLPAAAPGPAGRHQGAPGRRRPGRRPLGRPGPLTRAGSTSSSGRCGSPPGR